MAEPDARMCVLSVWEALSPPSERRGFDRATERLHLLTSAPACRVHDRVHHGRSEGGIAECVPREGEEQLANQDECWQGNVEDDSRIERLRCLVGLGALVRGSRPGRLRVGRGLRRGCGLGWSWLGV